MKSLEEQEVTQARTPMPPERTIRDMREGNVKIIGKGFPLPIWISDFTSLQCFEGTSCYCRGL